MNTAIFRNYVGKNNALKKFYLPKYSVGTEDLTKFHPIISLPTLFKLLGPAYSLTLRTKQQHCD